MSSEMMFLGLLWLINFLVDTEMNDKEWITELCSTFVTQFTTPELSITKLLLSNFDAKNARERNHFENTVIKSND